jgi:hypothetical protein
MKKSGVILTKNYEAVKFLRFESDKEAEKAYEDYKKKGYGVVKVNIEKANEIHVMNAPEP